MTGEILAKGPSGELMVQGASTAKYSTKKCKKDSTCVKNPNVGEGWIRSARVRIAPVFILTIQS